VEQLFITDELMMAIQDMAKNRSKAEVIKHSDRIYSDLKRLTEEALKYKNGEWLIKTVDRKIGKTYALIKVACEYQIPIAVKGNDLCRLLEREAKEELGQLLQTINVNLLNDRRLSRVDIVLKDEGTPVRLIRERLGDNVRIVGICSFFGEW